MSPPLSNKALAVLGVLREMECASCKAIAAEVMARTPCGACNGSGVADDARCRKCWGRGLRSFSYSDAYVVLQQLVAAGRATRRFALDEFGDVTRRLVFCAADPAVATATDDPLEALYQAPALGEA